MKTNIVQEKSYRFALKIIDLNRKLRTGGEQVISRRLLKSGTSVGANVEEALAGQGRADFVARMSIASQEAREAGYWLRLLRDSETLDRQAVSGLLLDVDELNRLLTSIVKTTKER